MGQTLNRVDTTISYKSAAEPADLAIKSEFASSGIIIDTHKTFGGKFDGVVYGFDLGGAVPKAAFYTARLEATNGGSIEVAQSPYAARAGYGTGATVVVKNADGSVAKTYVIVIFGDMNGDGRINAQDSVLVIKHASNESPINDEVKIMAANAHDPKGRPTQYAKSLHTIDSTDSVALLMATSGESVISQVKCASNHNTYNTYYQ